VKVTLAGITFTCLSSPRVAARLKRG